MATLADELLNDFEDSGSENEAETQDENGLPLQSEASPTNGIKLHSGEADAAMDEDDDDGDHDEITRHDDALKDLEDEGDEEEAKAKVERMDLGGISDVRSVAGLMKTLEPVLQKIAHYQSLPPEKQTTHIGSIEDNPEYHLLTQSNTLSTSIYNEIILVHKFIRDHYSARFPELDTLITGPLDYAKAVAIIGNGPMDNPKDLARKADNFFGASLDSVLDKHTLMIVTTEAMRTRGSEMTSEELQTVMLACDMVFSLDRAKKTLSDYVQSRMTIFAPNLTTLIGSLTAAQLLNSVGGLTGLSNTPDRNLPSLGSKKQVQTGFARNVGIRQQGFLYHSPLIQDIPDDLKKRAMRIVSAKIVLAARVDRVHSNSNGSEGEKLRQDCLDRLDKLTEPPPNKGPKALPAPDDKPSRKRGGRRARKAKEATAMTDIRKAQNRMAFGKEEQEVGYGTGEGTKGLGMIGQANDGRIRALQIDQRTKAKLSKKNQGWGTASSFGGTASSLGGFGQGLGAGNASVLRAAGLRSSGVGGSSAGTASSIAFTPVQGLELVNPESQKDMKRKRQEEEDRWFKGGTFTQVGSASVTTSVTTKDGFKVPQLPGKAKEDGRMGPPAAKKLA